MLLQQPKNVINKILCNQQHKSLLGIDVADLGSMSNTSAISRMQQQQLFLTNYSISITVIIRELVPFLNKPRTYLRIIDHLLIKIKLVNFEIFSSTRWECEILSYLEIIKFRGFLVFKKFIPRLKISIKFNLEIFSPLSQKIKFLKKF